MVLDFTFFESKVEIALQDITTNRRVCSIIECL